MSTPEASAIRVVVVDDHPIVRDGLIGIFAREQDLAVVGEASDGREALVVIEQTAPDVVIMDLRMPGGDGVTAIRALQKRGNPARILVLTTYDTDRDILAAVQAGADGYLLKDAPRAELVRAIRDVAAGRPVLTPRALEALTARRRDVALTPREVEVLKVIAGGGTNRTAAETLMVSEATVKTHLVRAYEKLGVNDRAAAVRVAFERGLI
ncbi:response regulator transcription factor [Ammonicoccus fulvus]|uniref:Response regulator transcription factor n=1 Tax=Ammonicoccus fulvus TaxID=3138240 RepID=A0ABZ3FMC5_9ACTN